MRLRVAGIVAALVLLIVVPFSAVTHNSAEATPQTQTIQCSTVNIIGLTATLSCDDEIVKVQLPKQQTPPPVVDCDVVVGNQTRVVCSALGQVVLNQRLTLPTVTLPPITVTRTVTPPPIRLPGDTVTRTVTPEPRVIPGPTRTVTAEPENNTAPRRSPSPPQPTASITVDGSTPSPSASGDPDTITKTTPGETKFRTVVKKVGWGALASLGIFLLGLIAYIVGYRLGFGDGRKNEVNRNTRWIQNVLRRTKRS